MKRMAFKMKILPGMKEEYKRRHSQIWPELKTLLSESGVRDYSIFFDEETGTLFAVQKSVGEKGSQELGSLAIVQKWWTFMADIMETHEDDSPVSIELEEVFHMD